MYRWWQTAVSKYNRYRTGSVPVTVLRFYFKEDHNCNTIHFIYSSLISYYFFWGFFFSLLFDTYFQLNFQWKKCHQNEFLSQTSSVSRAFPVPQPLLNRYWSVHINNNNKKKMRYIHKYRWYGYFIMTVWNRGQASRSLPVNG